MSICKWGWACPVTPPNFCPPPYSSGSTVSGWTWWWMTDCPPSGTVWSSSTPRTTTSSGAPCWRKPTPSECRSASAGASSGARSTPGAFPAPPPPRTFCGGKTEPGVHRCCSLGAGGGERVIFLWWRRCAPPRAQRCHAFPSSPCGTNAAEGRAGRRAEGNAGGLRTAGPPGPRRTLSPLKHPGCHPRAETSHYFPFRMLLSSH